MPQRAVVLGGTSGLGYELAKRMLKEGVTPIVVGRTAARAAADPTLCGAEFIAYDLTDEQSTDFVPIITSGADYFFWVAGTFLRKPFHQINPREHRQLWQTHIHGPLFLLRQFMQSRLVDQRPFHLVTIASTSAFRLRNNESEYCAVQAAKAALTRQLAREWYELLPDTRTLLVLPGGMKTEKFWAGSGTDIEHFMDPAAVAKSIWEAVQSQCSPLYPTFAELNILRSDKGYPVFIWGQQTPEAPVRLYGAPAK